jgi:DNA-binding Lrp family transcriptional regulator
MKLINQTNAEIIGALSKHDPRNISAISKDVGLPNSTMAFRIKKLIKNLNLEINARVDFNKIGLTRAIVFAETHPAKWNKLWNIMENMGCLTYLTKCHGRIYGCYAIFAFPASKETKLEEYFKELKNMNIISSFQLFWTTNLCEVHPNFKWYDFEKKKWTFLWEQWTNEIYKASESLPEPLKDPKEYPIKADKKDLLLLSQLEKNGILSYEELAKIADMNPRTVAYRYKKHLTDRKLILDHMVWFLPYPNDISDACSFVIEFESEKSLAKFANTLDETPFVLSYAKVIASRFLIINTYIPKAEFTNFINSLNTLAEDQLIINYFHVTLTLDPHKRGGIPHQYFKNKAWKCNLEDNIKPLSEITKER